MNLVHYLIEELPCFISKFTFPGEYVENGDIVGSMTILPVHQDNSAIHKSERAAAI